MQVEERQPAAVLDASKNGYFLDAEGYLLPGETVKVSQGLPVLEGISTKFFHEHLDESYDEKTDVNERIDIIVRKLGILSEDSNRFYLDTHDKFPAL